VDIASTTGIEPDYYVPYDTTRFPYPAFYTDELSYYNVILNITFPDLLHQKIAYMLQTRQFTYINFYSYYIQFLKNAFHLNWVGIIFFTGVLYNIIFTITMFYILTTILRVPLRKVVPWLLFIEFSPPYLQLISSWIRDLLIIDLLLLAFVFAMKKRFFSWSVVTLLQLLIRAYMVPLHVLFLLYFFPNMRHNRNRSNHEKWLAGIGIVAFSLVLVLMQVGFRKTFQEIPGRLVENFTGLTISLLKGNITLRGDLYDYLFNIEMLSIYFYPIFYLIFYISLFVRISILRVKSTYDQKKYISTFLFVGLYIVILHSAYIGFFVSRIQFITMVFGYIALASFSGGKYSHDSTDN